MTLPLSAADVLGEHVVFELECIDRVYCSGGVGRPRVDGGRDQRGDRRRAGRGRSAVAVRASQWVSPAGVGDAGTPGSRPANAPERNTGSGDCWWSGRREAPRAARQSRLAPVSSRPPINRTLGFPQSGWKRAHISDRVPRRVRGDGLLDQPSCRRQLAGWPAAFAAARGHDQRGAQPYRHCAPARDSRKRHYAQPFLQATATLAQRPFARARLCCPRRHRSYGLSRQSGALSATSRFAVIRRVFAIRSGLGWAPDLPHFETSILSLVPPPLRRGAPRVHMSDFFPADAGLRPVLTGSALPDSHSWP